MSRGSTPLRSGWLQAPLALAITPSNSSRGWRAKGGRNRLQSAGPTSRVSTWRSTPSGKCCRGKRRPAGPGAPSSSRSSVSRGQAAGCQPSGPNTVSSRPSLKLRGAAQTLRSPSRGSRSSRGSSWQPRPRPIAARKPAAAPAGSTGRGAPSLWGQATTGSPVGPVNRRRAQRGLTSPS